MIYYTRQKENNNTVIYNFAVAKRCSSNSGIHVSISFTPAIRNARFEKTFTYLQGDLQSFVQPHWGYRSRPYRQFVWHEMAGDADRTLGCSWFFM